jgi:hypothetical protein
MLTVASPLRKSLRVVGRAGRDAALAKQTPRAKRAAAAPLKYAAEEKKARCLAPADAPALLLVADEAKKEHAAAPAPAVASSGALAQLDPSYVIINDGGVPKLVRQDDICDLTNSQSEDEREDAAFDRALAPTGVAQAVNHIKTEAEFEALIAGVVVDAAPALRGEAQAPSEFDFGTIFDAVDLGPAPSAPAAQAVAAPARAFVSAAAPIKYSGDEADDIMQAALAEMEAAPVKPMSVRQRELLKKFNVSAQTLDKITSSVHASKIIDAVMAARNRNVALVAAGRAQ